MQTVKLSELYDGLYDGPHATPKPAESGPVFLGIKNITEDGRLDLTNVRHISEDEFPKWTKRVTPQAGDIVFSYEATLHRYAIIPEGFHGCLGRRMALIRPNKDKVNTEYLFNYFFTDQWRTEVSKYILTGATVDRIPLTKVPDFEVTVHERGEQDEVAEVVSNYNNLVENNSRRIAILENMAQSLYREWFVKFRFPGNESCQFKDSLLGEIPKMWKVGIIKDLGVVHTGKTPSKNKNEYYASNDVPFLKTPDMHGSVFSAEIRDYLSYEGADSQKNKYIPKNSICVSCIGARAGVVTITASVVQTNQQINSIILNDISMREYFYLFAVSLHDKIHAIGSSGATMTNVSKGKFETIEVIIPSKEILDRFNLALKSQFDLILNLQKRNNNLKKQRDMLLPKLISGSISI